MVELQILLDRATKIIWAENEELRRNDLSGLNGRSVKKVNVISEISEMLVKFDMRQALLDRSIGIEKFRDALEENERLLNIQLKAANEASELVIDAVRKYESDGTYRIV